MSAEAIAHPLMLQCNTNSNTRAHVTECCYCTGAGVAGRDPTSWIPVRLYVCEQYPLGASKIVR